jgi:hypothetical protein
MNSREAHKIWIAQCEAAETVRARFGLPIRAAEAKQRPALASMAKAAAIGRHVLITAAMTPHAQPATAGVLSVATMPMTLPLLKPRFSKPKPITRAAAASTL